MASFSDESFNASNYLAFRPTYSPTLAQTIVDYHTQRPGNQLGLAVDLAAGTGQMCNALSPHFDQVYGLDVSTTMLEAAAPLPNVVYAVSPAEGPWDARIAPGSVDLVTISQAVHYFKRPDVWQQIRRMLKPGGTLAIFSYSFMSFPGKPQATRLLWDLGLNPAKYGDLWDAGRKDVDILYGDWDIPFANVQRLYSSAALVSPARALPSSEQSGAPETFIQRDLTPAQLEAYLHTWSAGKHYVARNPGHTTLVEDTVQQMMDGEGCPNRDQPWAVEWNNVLILGQNPSS
ncbi:S-adenosyl-L-methionine-dependent methyltransferase [Dimargaris cristalligena]|uniref:S-adenosyl-L-methionine-dependent methyltransferase n=1 Tax=Dimargaris cristalligena TaxID=215637 RepID=A0A4P9ZUM7_9FUNG|nr:S-adenosyl-L-methionine-dependent methyltransferase [Dimargaris cristalligena]|eukprot:RKP36300.1 S-adenosyl-L-methionine-dependent methyltransferase [Dimargaris cristalligena]